MNQPYCLNLKNGSYSMGDLNLMLQNQSQIAFPSIDFLNPQAPLFHGLIEQRVTVGGRTRRFAVYIPTDFPVSGPGLFLFPDDQVSAETCLASGWTEISEQFNLVLVVLESGEVGWSAPDIQHEITYCEAVFKQAISRTYFSLNEATYYAMGIGEGAYVATAFALLNSTVFSCLLCDGHYQLHNHLLDQLASIPSDRDETRSKLDVPMPAWLIRRSTESDRCQTDRLFDVLMRAGDLEDRGLSNAFGRVYLQNLKRYRHQPDGLPMTELRYTDADHVCQCSTSELYREMIAFAIGFKRWMTIGNGAIRAARTAAEMGLIPRSAVVDGRLREWFIYEPSVLSRCPGQKLPLVLAIHGYACTGSLFAENTEWHVLAEDRGFMVVYPTAFPSNMSFNGHTVPLPTWNAIGMPAETDDLTFIGVMLDQIIEQYPIDEERIYVTGHSNGSLMTQTLMAYMPLRFAAFAPQGAQFHIDLLRDGQSGERDIPFDGIERPVWLMMGSDDIGDQDKLEPGNANDLFIKMMCRLNQADPDAGHHLINGPYRTWTYMNNQQTPLVKFTGVSNTPHTFTPSFAQMYWDQFFCHFRRLPDGHIQYTI